MTRPPCLERIFSRAEGLGRDEQVDFLVDPFPLEPQVCEAKDMAPRDHGGVAELADRR